MAESNSVFISYRRDASAYLTLAIYQNLTANQIDSFYDIENINAGTFGTRILNQIAGRPYFMPILTPGTLDRCVNAGDWVLRELEHAMQLRRVFIPLHTPEFDSADIDRYLPAEVATFLKRHNMMKVPLDYFPDAMRKVCERFLIPIDLTIRPVPPSEAVIVARQTASLNELPPVTQDQLNAQEYFERALVAQNKGNLTAALADYDQAIRLNPQLVEAFSNRGVIRKSKGNLEGAIDDYDEAIRLDPLHAAAYYNNRGVARKAQGDLVGAIANYDAAIRLNPEYVNAYVNRAVMWEKLGDIPRAAADYKQAKYLDPKYAKSFASRELKMAEFFFERASEHKAKGDLEAAIADYDEAIRLNPQYVDAYNKRAARIIRTAIKKKR